MMISPTAMVDMGSTAVHSSVPYDPQQPVIISSDAAGWQHVMNYDHRVGWVAVHADLGRTERFLNREGMLRAIERGPYLVNADPPTYPACAFDDLPLTTDPRVASPGDTFLAELVAAYLQKGDTVTATDRARRITYRLLRAECLHQVEAGAQQQLSAQGV